MTNRVTTTSLSRPVFVHTRESGTVYVANFGNNTVAAISASSNGVNAADSRGNIPFALAETPDQKKLYAVNQTGTVTALSRWAPQRSPDHHYRDHSSVGRGSDTADKLTFNSGSGTVSAIDTATDQSWARRRWARARITWCMTAS